MSRPARGVIERRGRMYYGGPIVVWIDPRRAPAPSEPPGYDAVAWQAALRRDGVALVTRLLARRRPPGRSCGDKVHEAGRDWCLDAPLGSRYVYLPVAFPEGEPRVNTAWLRHTGLGLAEFLGDVAPIAARLAELARAEGLPLATATRDPAAWRGAVANPTRGGAVAPASAGAATLEQVDRHVLALRRLTALGRDPTRRGYRRVRREYAKLATGQGRDVFAPPGTFSYGVSEYAQRGPRGPETGTVYGPMLRGHVDLATGVLTLDASSLAERPAFAMVVAAQEMADVLLEAARAPRGALPNPARGRAAAAAAAAATPVPDEELLEHHGGHELHWWTELPRDPKFPRRRREREREFRLVYEARPGQQPGEFYYADGDYSVAQRTMRRHNFATRVVLRGTVDPATGALALDARRSTSRAPLAAVVDAQQMLDRLRARLADPQPRDAGGAAPNPAGASPPGQGRGSRVHIAPGPRGPDSTWLDAYGPRGARGQLAVGSPRWIREQHPDDRAVQRYLARGGWAVPQFYFAELQVPPECQGRGRGTAVARRLLAAAAAAGATRGYLYASTSPDRLPALVRLYERLGFVVLAPASDYGVAMGYEPQDAP